MPVTLPDFQLTFAFFTRQEISFFDVKLHLTEIFNSIGWGFVNFLFIKRSFKGSQNFNYVDHWANRQRVVIFGWDLFKILALIAVEKKLKVPQ